MYAEYAKDPRMRANIGIRRRLATLLDNDRDQIELFTALLLSLPGSPILYYGDEIGMGDNIWLGDRDAVRTPMQWTPGPQRGLLLLRSGPALPAGDHGPGLRLPGHQRRGGDELAVLAAALDPADGRDPQAEPGVRPGHLHRTALQQPGGAGVPAGATGDDLVLCVHNFSRFPQPTELDLRTLRRAGAGGADRRGAFPPIGELAVPADPGGPRLLLVPAAPAGRRPVRAEREPSPSRPPVPRARRRGLPGRRAAGLPPRT